MSTFEGVRIARQDEVDEIYKLLLDLHSENGLFTLDPLKARQTIVDLLDPKRGIIGVIEGPNGLEGSIGLFMTAWYYTSDLHLAEFWNFVRPDCRRSTHAKRLINFAKWAADNLGIPLHIGIVTTSRAEAKERLYRRQLKHVGSYFMHGASPRLSAEIDDLSAKAAAESEVLEDIYRAAKGVVSVGDPVQSKKQKQAQAEAMSVLRKAVSKAETVKEDEAA